MDLWSIHPSIIEPIQVNVPFRATTLTIANVCRRFGTNIHTIVYIIIIIITSKRHHWRLPWWLMTTQLLCLFPSLFAIFFFFSDHFFVLFCFSSPSNLQFCLFFFFCCSRERVDTLESLTTFLWNFTSSIYHSIYTSCPHRSRSNLNTRFFFILVRLVFTSANFACSITIATLVDKHTYIQTFVLDLAYLLAIYHCSYYCVYMYQGDCDVSLSSSDSSIPLPPLSLYVSAESYYRQVIVSSFLLYVH